MGTNGAVVSGSDAGMRMSVRVTKGKCVRVREGLRRRELLLLKKMRDLVRVSNSYIYIGVFCNFAVTGLYPGRVSDFLIKPGPASGFFF